MTAMAYARAERRRQRLEQERKRREEIIIGIAALIIMLAAFALAGTMDYKDRVNGLSGEYLVQGW